MASTPVDDHTEEFEQLAGLAALEILEGDELARFEQHVDQCERCRLMLRLDREALAVAMPEMDPSPGFKDRLMQRAAQELAAAAPAQAPPAPIPLHRAPTPIPLWRRSPWVSAVAAVLVVALVSAGAFSYQNQVIASYPLHGTLAGSAVVEVRRSGAAELRLRGVSNPPPGLIYEAWIIPDGGQPIPAGVTSSGDAELPLIGVSSGSTIAITEERERVGAPTTDPVMVTVVQQL
jgi:anti-sigma-K factor RskA